MSLGEKASVTYGCPSRCPLKLWTQPQSWQEKNNKKQKNLTQPRRAVLTNAVVICISVGNGVDRKLCATVQDFSGGKEIFDGMFSDTTGCLAGLQLGFTFSSVY